MTPVADQFAKNSAELRRRYVELWREIGDEMARFDAERFASTAGETHNSGDEATADLVADINLAAVHRDVLELRDIQAALERITAREYGVCTDCGAEISIDRLAAYPTAKRCHACQQRHERQLATPRPASL